MNLDADPDALFVSSNPAVGPCTRFRPGPKFAGTLVALIGAQRDPHDPTVVSYFPERVIMIPGSEARTYSKEYRRALREGSLVRRTREEYLALMAAEQAEIDAERVQRDDDDDDGDDDAESGDSERPSSSSSDQPGE